MAIKYFYKYKKMFGYKKIELKGCRNQPPFVFCSFYRNLIVDIMILLFKAISMKL